MFDEEYYKQVYNVNDLNKLDMHWWSNYFYSNLARRFCLNKNGNMLELGCGFGGISARLERYFHTYAIDLSSYALSKAKEQCENTKLFLYDIEQGLKKHFANILFDVILARYVFEHLKNPKKVIIDCGSILRENGILIFAVPNTQFLLRKFKGEEWQGIKDKTHISLKNPYYWIQDVKEAGLTVLKIFGDGCWDIPYFKSIPKLLQYPLLLPTALEVITAVPFIPLGLGENLIVICRK